MDNSMTIWTRTTYTSMFKRYFNAKYRSNGASTIMGYLIEVRLPIKATKKTSFYHFALINQPDQSPDKNTIVYISYMGGASDYSDYLDYSVCWSPAVAFHSSILYEDHPKSMPSEKLCCDEGGYCFL